MGCPPRVQAALESVDGVENVVIDYKAKTATVTATEGTETTAMIAALKDADYGASIKN
ncbi:MAG: copper chaperone CopZ [Planctomycetota bacterium]|jgi:copper chaperone CopZ